MAHVSEGIFAHIDPHYWFIKYVNTVSKHPYKQGARIEFFRVLKISGKIFFRRYELPRGEGFGQEYAHPVILMLFARDDCHIFLGRRAAFSEHTIAN